MKEAGEDLLDLEKDFDFDFDVEVDVDFEEREGVLWEDILGRWFGEDGVLVDPGKEGMERRIRQIATCRHEAKI